MTTDVYVPLAAVCWLTTAPTFAAFSHILSLPFSLPRSISVFLATSVM